MRTLAGWFPATGLPAWTPLALLLLLALLLALFRRRTPPPAAVAPAQTARPPWYLSPGMRIHHYEVLELLGEGGSGIVYKVRSPQGQELALKLLKLRSGEQAEDRARFRREMKVLRRINHPNLPFLADFGEFNGLDYLVMELLGQTTLKQKLPLPARQTVEVMLQLASALGFCHKQDILHRDIKPENVIWSEGRVRLSDFGLARHRDSTMVTQEGTVMGTPDSMAPEVIRGEPFTPLSDQYSLGCLGYHMLRGQPPFQGKSPIAVLMQHLEAPPPPLENIPEALHRVLFRMLEKDPTDRFPDMAEVQQQLLNLAPTLVTAP